MTFFERYFEALDGPDPHCSLELVADDVEFSIQWAAGERPRAAASSSAASRSCAAFIDAGDTRGWAHHVRLQRHRRRRRVRPRRDPLGRVGERIGTFLAVAQLDDDGRMRALHGGALAGDRVRHPVCGSMPGQRDFVPVADGLIAGTADEPRAHRLALPQLRRRDLPAPGVLRGVHVATTSRSAGSDVAGRCGPGRSSASRPSRRRTREPAEDFEPYGVGYVELPGEVRVEARLTEADPAQLRIGMPMELVLVPAPGDGGAVTFAFRPAEDGE